MSTLTKLCLPPTRSVHPINFTVPAKSCDCHAHVIGPVSKFPYSENRSYTPPEASLESYQQLHQDLGIERAVIVQPSIHGLDNRVTIDAIERYGSGARGVVVIDESVDQEKLEYFDNVGVRGVRVNLLFRGGIDFSNIEKLIERILPLNWHLQLLMDVSTLLDSLHQLEKLPVDLVFDHMGHMKTDKGLAHAGFQALIHLLSERKAWAKVSGNYRISSAGPPYTDAIPFAQALIAAAPDRVVWGSDWPHPSLYSHMPNDGDLLNSLIDFAPGSDIRDRILVDNPATLYGFEK